MANQWRSAAQPWALRQFRQYILAVGLAFGGPLLAEAALITFSFTGSAQFGLPGYITQGETVTIAYTFESTTPDIIPNPVEGEYANAILSFTITSPTLGSLDLTTPPGVSQINANNGNIDSYQAGAFTTASPSPIAGFSIFWLDVDATMFSSDALPLTTDFVSSIDTFPTFSVRLSDGEVCTINGNPLACRSIDLLSPRVTAVPEPLTATLVVLGLAGLGWSRRKK